MAKTILFVYGTLKRGQRAHHLLAGQQFRGEARTLPRYRLYDNGSYPCLVEEPERGVAVQGELWEVADAILHRLDRYEGVPELFCRKEVAMEGLAEPVCAYFYRADWSGFRDCGGAWPG
jgi:gamma-glutamylaminecyclotransferase